MKRLKLLAIAILIGGSSVFAFENKNPDPVTPAPLLRAQIVELLPTGDFDIYEETAVKIHFTYNNDGEIVVLRVATKNKNILNYIRKNLNYKKVDLPGETGELYSLILRIEPI